MCRSHYMRWWRYGDTSEVRRVNYETVEARFWAQVDVAGEDDCWNWKTSLDTAGYGRIKIVGINAAVGAHVYSYKLKYGDYPKYNEDGKRLDIDHLCRNPKCVNPKHLELVTAQVNNLRGIGAAAQNAKKTHCPQGHEYTESNIIWEVNGTRRRCKICKKEQIAKCKAKKRWSSLEARL